MTGNAPVTVELGFEQFLREICTLTGINCTVKSEGIFTEHFFEEPDLPGFRIVHGGVAMEAKYFHIHFKLADLKQLKFFDELGPHDNRVTYAVVIDTQDRERMRLYFPNPGRNMREYSPAELQFFDNMRIKYQHLAEPNI